MRLTNSKINRIFNTKIIEDTNTPKIEPKKENMVNLYPFELVMGFVTQTEAGQNGNNVDVYDYSTFEKIFTGLENVLAKWEDAYKVTVINEDDGFLKKTYSVGRHIKAINGSLTSSASFEPSPVSSDFLQEVSEEGLQVLTYDPWDHEKDTLKLFICPTPSRKFEKWLYVESATKYFSNDGKYQHTLINLRTLNSRIATTGGAKEQFVNRSAPGEGYAWPKETINDEGEVIINVDETKARDYPIKSVQTEFGGPALLNSMVAYGRPTKVGINDGISTQLFNPEILPSRLLLPYTVETPVISPINTRPTYETDYVVFNESKPILDTYFGDYRDSFTGNWDKSKRSTFEGHIELKSKGGIGIDKTIETINSVTNSGNGTHEYQFWDDKWTVPAQGAYKLYGNELFKQTLDKNLEPQETEFGANIDKQISLPRWLSNNFFITKHLESLPMSVRQNVKITANSNGSNATGTINGELNSLDNESLLRDLDIKVKLSKLLNSRPVNIKLNTSNDIWKFSNPTYIEEASKVSTINPANGSPFQYSIFVNTDFGINEFEWGRGATVGGLVGRDSSAIRYDQDSSRNSVTRSGLYVRIWVDGLTIKFGLYWTWTGKLGSDHYMVDANVQDLKRYKRDIESEKKRGWFKTFKGDARTDIPGTQTTMFDRALTKFKNIKLSIIPK